MVVIGGHGSSLSLAHVFECATTALAFRPAGRWTTGTRGSIIELAGSKEDQPVSGAPADSAQGQHGLTEKLGVGPGSVVQEIGWDEDCDEELRRIVTERTGQDLVDEDYDDVVDAVMMWWREGDGDLVDALVDALAPLADHGVIWLLTPKAGRDGHVEPSDVSEAAPTAGLQQTSSISAGRDWNGARLVAPRAARGGKR
jgi:hypothetical protein